MSAEQGGIAEHERARPLRPRLIQAGWFVAAICGAAYLWAVVVGDGIAGLTDGYSLGRRANSDLPTANVALIAALVVYIASRMLAWWTSPNGRLNISRRLMFSTAAGLVVFAASSLFT